MQTGFDRCIRMAEANRVSMYDLFLHRGNAKNGVLKNLFVVSDILLHVLLL